MGNGGLDLDELEDEGDDTTDDSDSPEGSESEGDKTPKSSDKRISDLQSKADKETARANKAEAQLKRLMEAANGTGAEDGTPAGGGNVATNAINDMARMFAFQQHPKLAEYGFSAADLDGGTPSEVAERAVELVARFEKIETQARNKVLAEHGLVPEIDGATPPAPSRDYSKMSKEDFDKVVEDAMKRR